MCFQVSNTRVLQNKWPSKLCHLFLFDQKYLFNSVLIIHCTCNIMSERVFLIIIFCTWQLCHSLTYKPGRICPLAVVWTKCSFCLTDQINKNCWWHVLRFHFLNVLKWMKSIHHSPIHKSKLTFFGIHIRQCFKKLYFENRMVIDVHLNVLFHVPQKKCHTVLERHEWVYDDSFNFGVPCNESAL